jgi:hypothetical protein
MEHRSLPSVRVFRLGRIVVELVRPVFVGEQPLLHDVVRSCSVDVSFARLFASGAFVG